MLELVRVAAGGVLIGAIVGKLLAENPSHIDRLRPSAWKRELRRMKRRKWISLLTWPFLVAIACIFVTGSIGGLLESAGVRVVEPEEDLTRKIAEASRVLCLLVVLLLPILEEWVFRGIFIDEMMELGASKVEAVAVPALAFAAFHLSNPGAEPAIVLLLFPAGVLLGLCYLKTGLPGSIVAHSTYNFILFMLSYA